MAEKPGADGGAATDEIGLMSMKEELVVREFPESQNDFFRVQVGRWETRPEMVPHDSAGRASALIPSGKSVPVFRLLGYGRTLQEAQGRVPRNK
jgi:hypothetical protein